MTDEVEVAPETEATEEVVTEDVQEQAPEADAEPEQEASEDSSEDAAGEEEDPRPKLSKHQKRKAAFERLRAENEELAKENQATQERLKAIDDAMATPAPKQDDFETYEEYNAALAGWHAVRQLDSRNKAEIEREAGKRQQKMQDIEARRQQEVAQGWQAQIAEAKARYADFEQVALSPTVPITPKVAQLVASMDAGADVAYHLGLNPDVAQYVSALPPVEAAMELGRIEARLSAPKPRTSTKAPDPVNPVKPKASAVQDYRKMTADEYNAWRDAGGIPD